MDRRIRKIRNQALLLSLSGIDVMFVAENPEHPVGDGATFLFGSDNVFVAKNIRKNNSNFLESFEILSSITFQYFS